MYIMYDNIVFKIGNIVRVWPLTLSHNALYGQ
jgi:hypothetical protein